MKSTTTLQAADDEVLQKIGRNLLLFQQAEQLIKHLVAIDSLSIRNGESDQSFDKHAAFCHKMTMGQVAKLFLDRICSPLPPSESELAAATPSLDGISLTVRIRFGIGLDPEVRKKSFEDLVAERNELVHQLGLKYNNNSLESCINLAKQLDEQRRKILPEIQRLQQEYEFTRSMFNTISAFLKTPAGVAELLQPEIQQSPLIRNLAEIAGRSTHPQGWTALREATQQLIDFPAANILTHCNQFGQKSLSALLYASGIFDTEQQEKSDTRHGRTFYRLKCTAAPSLAAQSVS